MEKLNKSWEETGAASDFAPLPPGVYVARILSGEYSASAHGTPGYRLTLQVLEGPHAGRRFWHTAWLTNSALPYAKRDLIKLGITSPEMLDKPLPFGIRVQVRLVVRANDDGVKYNEARDFKKIGIDSPDDEDFPPGPTPTNPGASPAPQYDIVTPVGDVSTNRSTTTGQSAVTPPATEGEK